MVHPDHFAFFPNPSRPLLAVDLCEVQEKTSKNNSVELMKISVLQTENTPYQVLQCPVINRAGAGMHSLNIDIGDARIPPDHFQTGMAQQFLKGEDVALRA